MKIAYCSDLHLEFWDYPGLGSVEPADVLILAGDCFLANDFKRHPIFDPRVLPEGSARLDRAVGYVEFLKKRLEVFGRIIMVAGNHEYYGSRHHAVDEFMRSLGAIDSRITFLQQESVDIDGVRFIGATMWSDFDKGNPLTMYDAKSNMNDFTKITFKDGETYRKFSPGDAARIHSAHKRWIFDTAKSSHLPCVVVTHHAPSFESIPEQFWRSSLNGAYASELSPEILSAPQIKAWVHGHIHTETSYSIGETTVYANPRGYIHHGEGIDWEMRYFTID